MFWGAGSPELDSIIALAEDESTPLETLLSDSSLLGALSYETESVVKFLSAPARLTRLLQWSLSEDFKDDPNYLKYTKTATRVSLAESTDFVTEVAESTTFISFIAGFFQTPALNSPIHCGNFQRITCRYIRESNGDLAEALPNLIPDLIRNLHILSFRVMIFDLLTELKTYINSIDPIIEQLTAIIPAGGRVAQAAVSVFRDVLKDERPLLAQSDLQPTVRSVFEFILLDTTTDLQKAEAYVLLELIIAKLPGDFQPILREYEPRIDFTSSTIAGLAVHRVFRNALGPALDKFFASPSNAVIGGIVLSSLLDLPRDQLVETIEKLDLVRRVADAFSPDAKGQGVLTEIALLIHSCPGFASAPRWQQFLADAFDAKMNWIASIGGERELSPYRLVTPTRVAPPPQIEKEISTTWDMSSSDDEDFDEDDSDSDDDDQLYDLAKIADGEKKPRKSSGSEPPAPEEVKPLSDEDVLARAFGTPGGAEETKQEEEDEPETEAQRQAYALMSAALNG
jgi:hypothetical protein